jgi:phosphate transport system substrate-binding protein
MKTDKIRRNTLLLLGWGCFLTVGAGSFAGCSGSGDSDSSARSGDWPDHEIKIFAPDTDSGTYDYFVEAICEDTGSRSDYTPSSDDNILVRGISEEKYAIGYFGYAYYVENKDQLKAVAISPTDSLEDAVLPTDETVESGEYTPLSRPLFIYVSVKELQRPEVAAFVNYYLDEGQDLVKEVGYVGLKEERVDELRTKVNEALKSAGVESSESTELKGDIAIDGSSTVYPISQAVAEEFQKIHEKVNVIVNVSGTGGGFERFARGETAISDASRPIKEKEIAECKSNGIEFIELQVAIDGLTVVVNPENEWCDAMTVAQLKKLFEKDSKVTKWSELKPSEEAEETGSEPSDESKDSNIEESEATEE